MLAWDDGAGSSLYLGGGFSGNGYNGIARWNGTGWSTVGNGVTSSGAQVAWVQSMAVFDDDGPGPHAPALYVGGSFEFAGGQPARGIAKWDGTSWSALGAGLNNVTSLPSVHSMAAFDDGSGPALYVSGYFHFAGGTACNGLARWNGTNWSTFGGNSSADAKSMAVFDDGSGPALFMAGVPGYNPPSPLNGGLAKWDGTAWTAINAVSSVFVDVPSALAVYDAGSGPGLYIGGAFTQIGGIAANRIARYGLPLCPANCDGSRTPGGCPTLSANDFECYLSRYAAADQRANCDASSNPPTLNANDFQCFLNAYAVGCT